jgi:hypothetical protein
VHPWYAYYVHRGIFEYDIGLLKMTASMDKLFADESVMPACLPTNSQQVILL